MTPHVSAPIASTATKGSFCHADYARFMPLVRRIARHLVRRLPSHIELDDLMSFGWIGLAEALKRSPVGMPLHEFEAYAAMRVRGAMIDYLRTLDPNARSGRNAARRVARAAAGAALRSSEEGVNAEPAIAAAETDAARVETFHRVDIDDVDPSSDATPADELVERAQLSTRIADAISTLPQREQQILSLYYRDECTLKEIGAILGVTDSRVSQILTATVRELRAQASS